MPDTETLSHDALIQVTVLGQEGDDKVVTINSHEPCA